MASGSSLLLVVYLIILRPYLNPCLNLLVVLKFLFLGISCVCSILASRFYGEALQETYPSLEWAISSCTLLAIIFFILTMITKLVFLYFIVSAFFIPNF
jgi:hypothetical protein